ncbi:MAG: Re/Si-specific NAD(P)(+) transhydrogenase subunit alpha [Gammaproteobacteria bacterium]|nr:Re/Si-specific NAD(P)(+) transhydrogenase subunit alpha [Gammaproteobacteria bacterium]
MKIGIPKETDAGETRVACVPAQVEFLRALGHEVLVERGAGAAAGFADADYQNAGAETVADADALWTQAQLVCKVRPPRPEEAARLTAGKTFIGFFYPAQNQDALKQLAAAGATVIAMDAVPRISRAQNMDALSSMAHIAGYRAVIEAGRHFGRFFAGQSTAAGRIPPAKALVIGAGVAGLSAIGAAVSLGAVVRAFDTRPEVAEQIASLRAEPLRVAGDFDADGSGQGGYAKVMSAEFLKAEMALFAQQAREVDIIITTALVPGKPAPKLITADMVAAMPSGGVVVDLAAEQGGNCALTVTGEAVVRHRVTVIGYTDLPARMPAQASQLYAANIGHLLAALTPGKDGELAVNLDDEVIRGCTVAHRGEVTWPPPAATPSPKPAPAAAAPSPTAAASAKPQPSMPTPPGASPATGKTAPTAPKTTAPPPPAADSPAAAKTPTVARPGIRRRGLATVAAAAIGAAAVLAVGAVAPAAFMGHFTVFVLACFVGWQVIWRVTPALHTPLMSVTNAISSIIVIGALLLAAAPDWRILALFALLLASINIAGGFLVTHRMLKMFHK